RQFLLLSTIGQTRHPAAIGPLRELIWREPSNGHGDAPAERGRDDVPAATFQEGLQARAVEMVAYIGGSDADAIVREAASSHPSAAVRHAAIDAYLFNRDDSEDEKTRLRELVSDEDKAQVDAMRFTREMDVEAFREHLARHRDQIAGRALPRPANRPPRPRGEYGSTSGESGDDGPRSE